MSWQYFKVKADRVEYLGERYFKFDVQSEKVVQVCMSVGDVKKGKSNTFGTYLIHRMTFLTNYMAMGYVEAITKKQYDKMFNRCYDFLR